MAEAPRSRTAAGYAGRESASTRNPHSAKSTPDKMTAAQVKELTALSPDERILAQWRAACGCPLSDEAKAQFCVNACERAFRLADVRLWQENHPQRGFKEKGSICLEFFFDGYPDEIEGKDEEFKRAFEEMVSQQLQDRRIADFRRKLAARKRRGVSADDEGDGIVEGGDDTWNSFLHTPVPETELSIRSLREAGCMLRFIVIQTSVSTGAAEALGQVAFQEHFPIDGIAQEPSKSEMPLPQWVYGALAFTLVLMAITILAWWKTLMGLSTGAFPPPALDM